MWESYNRLMATSRTTLYHIHDSTLKASMAWSPLICVLALWVRFACGRAGVHFTGTLVAKLRLGFLRRLWRCWHLAACFQKAVELVVQVAVAVAIGSASGGASALGKHWWRGGGRVIDFRLVYGEEEGTKVRERVRDGLARAVLLPLMTSARSTAPWPSGPLALAMRDASTDHVRLSKGLTRPKLSGRLHNRFRGTSAVPSERDAHRRPASASISQHEETGNSRACKLPISACFFSC